MKIKINGIYKHFKGTMMEVLMVATHSETQEEMVIYRHLTDGKIWARPYEMFAEKVDKIKYPEIDQEYRFEFQKNKN